MRAAGQPRRAAAGDAGRLLAGGPHTAGPGVRVPGEEGVPRVRACAQRCRSGCSKEEVSSSALTPKRALGS